MKASECVSAVVEESATLGAMAGITFLAWSGVTDVTVLALLAGLGGYRMKQAQSRRSGDG